MYGLTRRGERIVAYERGFKFIIVNAISKSILYCVHECKGNFNIIKYNYILPYHSNSGGVIVVIVFLL